MVDWAFKNQLSIDLSYILTVQSQIRCAAAGVVQAFQASAVCVSQSRRAVLRGPMLSGEADIELTEPTRPKAC